ncbi:MAG: hypothetical protein ACRDVL_09305 [Acidimicrobiia bacterium]
MTSSITGDPIADLRSRHGSLISLYAERPSPGGFAALLSDLVKPIREQAESLDRRVEKSLLSDADRIHDLADGFELDSAPAYAVFSSMLDEVFQVEPLGHSVPNVATFGPRPYLRPLRAAPRSLRAGILVADRALARVFVGFDGVIRELGSLIEADIGKPNFGGFAGYAEHNVRSRADEVSAKLWKEAGSRLLETHLDRPFDYLAIGGHGETVEDIASTFHPYLTELPRVSFPASPQSAGGSSMRSQVADLDDEVRRQGQHALAGRVCDTTWSGGNAVLGLSEVLAAANAQAIDTLVIAGDFRRRGAICDLCGYLSREGGTCPICDIPMFEVADVVGSVMDATVAAGGRAVQLRVASPVDSHGVGAITRFPLPVVS